MRLVAGFAVASLLAACGAVPDLRFGGAEDASASPSFDATIGDMSDATASQPEEDSGGSSPPPSAGPDAASSGIDSAVDSAPPPSAVDAKAPDPCPGIAPAGATCCGAVECRPGAFNYCNCTSCAQCVNGEVCCMSAKDQFQQCASSIAACPKP
jgi:hypothetical protein